MRIYRKQTRLSPKDQTKERLDRFGDEVKRKRYEAWVVSAYCHGSEVEAYDENRSEWVLETNPQFRFDERDYRVVPVVGEYAFDGETYGVWREIDGEPVAVFPDWAGKEPEAPLFRFAFRAGRV